MASIMCFIQRLYTIYLYFIIPVKTDKLISDSHLTTVKILGLALRQSRKTPHLYVGPAIIHYINNIKRFGHKGNIISVSVNLAFSLKYLVKKDECCKQI